jgi:hypothetical protein
VCRAQKLQHAHQVLQVKLDTDARTHKQALAAAARERQQLEQQLEQLQQQLDAKDKEARANALAAKQAQRKLEEVKSSAAKAVAGVNARVAEAVAAEAARQQQMEDARVHLMLCILRDPGSSSSKNGADGKQQQQQVRACTQGYCCHGIGMLTVAGHGRVYVAALALCVVEAAWRCCRSQFHILQQIKTAPNRTAHFCGQELLTAMLALALVLQVDPGQAACSSSPAAAAAAASSRGRQFSSDEEAAVVLQAAARGHLARKQLQQRRNTEEAAAVLIQVGGQPGLCCTKNENVVHHALPAVHRLQQRRSDRQSVSALCC